MERNIPVAHTRAPKLLNGTALIELAFFVALLRAQRLLQLAWNTKIIYNAI